ncbi:L-aspartate oxidase [Salisediminibacterium beveridgei]|uniref:L-aspartate oxidase n=1 Tax=Salisediminibacterium beveridgei TaxID=632773 RepID=A0A1D7QYC5_9BACI|nr:FAD-dependent oxidoreductase [Salisediminibacterium beveridgei]AOM84012.1 L-aspartate oxidase [Salisediminibacterium beveridgei]
MDTIIERECIICGSGLAGLMTAYHLKDMNGLALLSAGTPEETNSFRAQGGIACVTDPADNLESHVHDTMSAGHFLNDPSAVNCLVEEGVQEVREWIRLGLPLDQDRFGRFITGQEGAHSFKRILHAGGDQTGKVFTRYLASLLDGEVETLHQMKLIDATIEPDGQLLLDIRGPLGRMLQIRTRYLILATGGIGGLFEQSSNHPDMTGTAIAIAKRLGLRTRDLHLIQYHPTLLRGTDGTAKGLVSEAVRGEGARIVTEDGTQVMTDIHPLLDLAPRDIVAGAMYEKERQGHKLFLDITMIKNFKQLFPQVYRICKEAGTHPENGFLPVMTGVHFHMGGIRTDLDGHTAIPGIYAVGETASSGVHGANRLASNALLECMVFAKRVATHLQLATDSSIDRRSLQKQERTPLSPQVDLPDLFKLKRLMTTSLGIHHRHEQIHYALKELRALDLYKLTNVSLQGVDAHSCDLINQWTAACEILQAALDAYESDQTKTANDTYRRQNHESVVT